MSEDTAQGRESELQDARGWGVSKSVDLRWGNNQCLDKFLNEGVFYIVARNVFSLVYKN